MSCNSNFNSKLHVFDEDFMPPTLILRERELKSLIEYAVPKFFNGVQFSAVFMSGDKGLGKTLTAKFFSKYVLENDLGKAYYFTCEKSLQLTLARFLRENYNISKYYRDVLITDVVWRIGNDNVVSYYLIFDDFQRLNYGADDLLFFTYESMKRLKKPFSIIVISQEPYRIFAKRIKDDTLSRMRFKFIGFSPYNAYELFQIIKQRLDLILKPEEYEEGAIRKISAFVSRVGKDARYALDITKLALSMGKLTMDVVDKAIRLTKDEYWKQELLKLPPHTALYLYAMAKVVSPLYQSNEEIEISSRIVREEYMKLCKKFNIQPMSNRMITHSIDKLEQLGYVKRQFLKSLGRGRGSELILKLYEKPLNILRGGNLIKWELILT